MHVSFEPYRNIDGGFKNSRPKSMYEERQRRKVEQNWNDVRRNLDCRSRNNLFAYIANRKNYKNWTREIFTSEKIIKSESNKRGLLSNLKT